MLAVLVLLFVVLPLTEIYVAVQVAHHIGAGDTILLLVIMSFAGAWLAKREGFGVLRRMQVTLNEGRMPANELIDTGLIFMGGVLMFVPGFVTGILGLFLLLPPVRALARNGLKHRFRNRITHYTGYTIRPAEPPRRQIGPDDIIDV
jgi:UPF0716 protein FxsA